MFGPVTAGEPEYARRLTVNLRAGMLLPGDRNFASAARLNQLAATGTDLLARAWFLHAVRWQYLTGRTGNAIVRGLAGQPAPCTWW
ncbi:hypothetical protein ACF08M_20415 [Streptomyces sp. NPDC015032]|uniref:hypothetical protein n=1 Tax=Streptomyces sp. NPDC015032 TaxID=3364937 RepID=UPI0036FCA3DC